VPDPSTTRLALYKSKSDGSELVNYSQDIGQNWDRVDAAVGFQIVTSSTRPSTPYSGKAIAESDTGRLYYSNGTLPASASWVEIASNGASFTMTGTRTVTLNGTANTTTKYVALVAGDTFNRFEQTADGTMNWGPGNAATDVVLARTGTSTLGTASGDHFKVGGDLKLVNGATTYRNALGPTSVTTVANTLTETVIATGTIPAADAVAGAIYRLKAWGIASVTGTPNFSLTARLGGVAGTAMGNLGPTPASSGVTAKAWTAEFELVCVTTGASGTWFPRFAMFQNISVATVIGSNHQIQQTAAVTRDTTASNAMVITWTWGTASSSNTATCQGYIFERVA
jgi:hypothetical protein